MQRPNIIYEDNNLSIGVYHIGKWRKRKTCPKCGKHMGFIAKYLCHDCQATENLKRTPNHIKHRRKNNDKHRKQN